MKTDAELLAWMEKQDWYDVYVSHCKDPECNPYKGAHEPELCGLNTMYAAFLWESTPEGYEYWKQVNSELRRFLMEF